MAEEKFKQILIKSFCQSVVFLLFAFLFVAFVLLLQKIF